MATDLGGGCQGADVLTGAAELSPTPFLCNLEVEWLPKNVAGRDIPRNPGLTGN